MADDQKSTKYQCPRCHSENIQSYPVIHSTGFSKINLTTVGVGFSDSLGVGRAESHGTKQTNLAAFTTPPKKKSVWKRFLFTWAIGSGPIVWILRLCRFDLIAKIAEIGSLILGCILAYLAFQWNKSVFPQLIQDWEHSYICLRCGARFKL